MTRTAVWKFFAGIMAAMMVVALGAGVITPGRAEAAASDKAITLFNFSTPRSPGIINEAAKTITVYVPNGQAVTSLTPSITTTSTKSPTSSRVSPASGTANNFTNPVTYTVTAADLSTQAYIVTVIISATTDKAIKQFWSYSYSAMGTINESNHTIAMTVPYGTTINDLQPYVAIAGASCIPYSAQITDFASPVTYTVTAADSSTQGYLVTVTVADPPPTPLYHFLSNVGHIDNGGFAQGVWGYGTYIYVANGSDGLRAYTFNGTTITLAGSIDDGDVGHDAGAVWGDGTYIYLANGPDGLRAYTFNGTTFTLASHIDSGGSAEGVWGNGTYIYLANDGETRAYTFSGTVFSSVGSIAAVGSATNVWGDGTYIYISDYTDGLKAYTFNGTTFTLRGSINDLLGPGYGHGIWGDGTYIYWAKDEDGLGAYTFNGSTFSNVGNIYNGGNAYDVWGNGGYLYLANYSDGLRTYTFNGTAFTNVGRNDNGGYGEGVWGNGTYIYLANNLDGLRAYQHHPEPKQVTTPLGTITVSSSAGTLDTLTDTPVSSLPPGLPPTSDMPYGAIGFTVSSIPPGATVTMTFTLPTVPPANLQFWKFINGAWVDCSSLLSGVADGNNTVFVTITDGGLGDSDGLANGVIVDPGVFVIPNIARLLSLMTAASHGSSVPAVTTPQAPVSLPNIQIQSASLSANTVSPGSPVTVTADIANKSTVNGSKKVIVYVNGQVESTQGLTVNSGSTSKLTFNVSRSEPGDYSVYVDGVPAGSFKVELFNATDAILIFSVTLMALAFLVGMVMLWRRQQRAG